MSAQGKLNAKVNAVNHAHKVALALYDATRKNFEGLVGKKIMKADGYLMEKYRSLIPIIKESGSRYYHKPFKYSFNFYVETFESHDNDGSVLYYHVDLNIGSIDNQVLTSIAPPPILKTDYFWYDILKLRENYDKAKEAADKAKEALYPFGEYDS